MNFSYNTSKSLSSISIYHNSHFSLDDIESVLEPLFGSYYGIEQLRTIISSADDIWCVYDRENNNYVACALVQSFHTDKVLYVNLFGVEQSHQGQGIGTLLLKKMKSWGRKKNYSAIILHTQVNNYKAIGLYEKVGFIKQYYAKNFFPPRGFLSFFQYHEPDAYQMILYL
ncbi:unnamed protein product [Rotaria sp. Silwood1]|nr:unnamed protein product [Rotaria sp. Silwood1]CAF1071488.1 unnamed protein product [Rotaria sp. Silwood1]CAF1078330.1 unnamed protein product [Rotaria sp. Silwood1]CAF3412159.1 unnamed protein product [Rotaria sp. Silwood1]CAF3436667.1 unnamed protein product [Rotaria sp. Silwood1]